MATVSIPLHPEEAQFLAANFPAFRVIRGTNFPVPSLAFDAATDETAHWKFYADSYGSGNLTVTVFWYADTATSGDVIWGAQLACITPNSDSQDIETDGLATANTVTDSHIGTTGQRLHSAAITVSNLDSIAAGDYVNLSLYRDANAGGDTMAGDALVVMVVVSYSDT